MKKIFIFCCLLMAGSLLKAQQSVNYKEFAPGNVWLDNNGVHINAHGGGILLHEGIYYWFGEHKTEGKAGNQAHVGVHCYSSTDLYNWKDEGIALRVSTDPASDIAAGCILERPKVIYNAHTKQFVMWFHLEPKGQGYGGAMVGIASAEKAIGPYTYIRCTRATPRMWPVNVLPLHKQSVPDSLRAERANLRTGEHPDSVNTLGRDFEKGQHSRDMTLFVDDDGRAYHVCSSESNSVIHINELTPDYLDFSGKYVRAFIGARMEAPAVFKKDGLYYFMGSECTGWRPNPAHSAVAPSIWGPWTELGNPCTDAGKETTYQSQSTFILPYKGDFIYMGDRWRPENAIDGRYVWLPVEFEGERFVIHWKEKWNINEIASSAGYRKERNFDVAANLKYCATQAAKTLPLIPDYRHEPGSIDNGQSTWHWTQSGSWTCGFWPGILWYLYEHDGNKKWLKAADNFTRAIIPPATGPARSHDVGFMAYCSIGNGYRLTGNPAYKRALLQAADSLATLYSPAVGTILSWPNMVAKMGWPHNTIIDNMMNLELLFWAAKNGGGERLYDIAFRHAETTMRHHFRPDFSTWHVAVYDSTTGAFIKGLTHQGYGDGTLWARGQAWAVYGFTMAYRETHDKRFLETARQAADIFLHRLPADMIPYWDYDAPNIPNEPRDASAAAIVAAALIELSSFVGDKAKSAGYMEAARKILLSLSSETYQSRDKNPAFLLHSTGHRPENKEVDASIIYADYYYIEALMRLAKYNN